MIGKDTALFVSSTIIYVLLTKYEQGRRQKREGSNNNDEKLEKALKDGTSLDAKERVCAVDKDNKILRGHGNLRHEMRLKNLWHRATYILVKHEPPRSFDFGTEESKDSIEKEEEVFVLVQKRSKLKDYCPGKLDPVPGGVVGHNEGYEENAVRELAEEMGISVRTSKDNRNSPHTMTRCFTFPYEDNRVRVWGDFYEVVYRGSIKDLKLQHDEVECVYRMSMNELQHKIQHEPNLFMPDSCYAMKLYIQRSLDKKLDRRLLKGYSSGDLENYKLRPKPKVIFFDCDDTMYFDDWNIASMLTAKIDEYCLKHHNLPTGYAYELYKKHGTALKGLIAEGYIKPDDDRIDHFLKEVHDLPISDLLSNDNKLRTMLLSIDPSIRKYIFTASVKHHAVRCLDALGVLDLFDQGNNIIDVKSCNLETKHSTHSFKAAMNIANVNDPESCLFLDDSITNISAAREIGWRSVLVGKIQRDTRDTITTEHAEIEIDRIHDMRTKLPELFQ